MKKMKIMEELIIISQCIIIASAPFALIITGKVFVALFVSLVALMINLCYSTFLLNRIEEDNIEKKIIVNGCLMAIHLVFNITNLIYL